MNKSLTYRQPEIQKVQQDLDVAHYAVNRALSLPKNSTARAVIAVGAAVLILGFAIAIAEGY